MAQDQVFEHLLSKSVVRISARVFEVQDPVLGTEDVDVDASAELLNVADQSSVQRVTIPANADASTSSSLVLRDDRRLQSIEASFTGQGPNRLKAAVSIGGVLLGAALAAVSPAAGAAVVMSSLAGVVTGRMATLGFHDVAEDDGAELVVSDPVLVAYAWEHPAAAEAIVAYRSALWRLSVAHARVAAQAEIDVEELTRLSKAMRLVRSQAALLEDGVAGWHLDQVERRLLRIVVEDLEIQDLPTTEELVAKLNTRGVPDLSDRELLVETPWAKYARDYGLAVSVDPIHTAALSVVRPAGEIEVQYRPGREVRLTTWSVERVAGLREWHGNGEFTEVDAHYVATPTEMVPTRVVPSNTEPLAFRLGIDAWRSGEISLKFNAIGEPSEIGGGSTPLGADAVAGVGDSLKSALETGSAISAALVPGSATAKSVERQLQIAKNRKELEPFLTVATADPEAEDLSALKESVEIAELEARLQIARLQQLRSSATVVYHVGI